MKTYLKGVRDIDFGEMGGLRDVRIAIVAEPEWIGVDEKGVWIDVDFPEKPKPSVTISPWTTIGGGSTTPIPLKTQVTYCEDQ